MNDFSAPGSNEPPTSPPSATPPGWYDDPWEPGAQRWWDGSVWTASTVRSTPGQDAAQSFGQPGATSTGSGLSEVTEWVGTVFRTAIGRAGHVFPIMMLTVLPSALLTAVFAWLSVRNARVNNLGCLLFDDAPEAGCASVTGLTTNYVLPMVLAGFWWLLAVAVFHLAVAHQLHGALDENKPTWAVSLRSGLRGLPRFLLYAIGTLIVLAVAYGVSLAVGSVVGPAGLAVVGFLWIPLALFLWVKLSFFTVAAAVAPPRTNLLSASSSVSDGRFAGVFGRLCVLVLLSIAVFIGSQAFSFPLNLTLGPGINEGLAQDILDEQRAPDSFAIVELVTKPAALAISLVLINVLTSSIVATIQTAGAAALYRETGGPRNDPPATGEPVPVPTF